MSPGLRIFFACLYTLFAVLWFGLGLLGIAREPTAWEYRLQTALGVLFLVLAIGWWWIARHPPKGNT
jgi:uncharacterized integral membrane protein